MGRVAVDRHVGKADAWCVSLAVRRPQCERTFAQHGRRVRLPLLQWLGGSSAGHAWRCASPRVGTNARWSPTCRPRRLQPVVVSAVPRGCRDGSLCAGLRRRRRKTGPAATRKMRWRAMARAVPAVADACRQTRRRRSGPRCCDLVSRPSAMTWCRHARVQEKNRRDKGLTPAVARSDPPAGECAWLGTLGALRGWSAQRMLALQADDPTARATLARRAQALSPACGGCCGCTPRWTSGRRSSPPYLPADRDLADQQPRLPGRSRRLVGSWRSPGTRDSFGRQRQLSRRFCGVAPREATSAAARAVPGWTLAAVTATLNGELQRFYRGACGSAASRAKCDPAVAVMRKLLLRPQEPPVKRGGR